MYSGASLIPMDQWVLAVYFPSADSKSVALSNLYARTWYSYYIIGDDGSTSAVVVNTTNITNSSNTTNTTRMLADDDVYYETSG